MKFIVQQSCAVDKYLTSKICFESISLKTMEFWLFIQNQTDQIKHHKMKWKLIESNISNISIQF